jgi:hypothetical protein
MARGFRLSSVAAFVMAVLVGGGRALLVRLLDCSNLYDVVPCTYVEPDWAAFPGDPRTLTLYPHDLQEHPVSGSTPFLRVSWGLYGKQYLVLFLTALRAAERRIRPRPPNLSSIVSSLHVNLLSSKGSHFELANSTMCAPACTGPTACYRFCEEPIACLARGLDACDDCIGLKSSTFLISRLVSSHWGSC